VDRTCESQVEFAAELKGTKKRITFLNKTAELKNAIDPIVTPNTIIHERETQYTRFKHGNSNGFTCERSYIYAVF